jgi:aspartate kinase
MISSKILSEYLNDIQFSTIGWMREIISKQTVITEKELWTGKVNKNISKLDKINCYVTQGFIGSESNNFTVTLGREGSDYTAAIFLLS